LPEDQVLYKGSSPDEEALVKAAANIGVALLQRNNDDLVIVVNEQEEKYKLLQTLEFSSDRKRMSVVVQRLSANGAPGKIYLFTKGADDMVFAACANNADQQQARAMTVPHLEMFASTGLRTLCMAMKEIPDEEYTGTCTPMLISPLILLY
jgi:magnesium-transporting ATPase (P-type)